MVAQQALLDGMTPCSYPSPFLFVFTISRLCPVAFIYPAVNPPHALALAAEEAVEKSYVGYKTTLGSLPPADLE